MAQERPQPPQHYLQRSHFSKILRTRTIPAFAYRVILSSFLIVYPYNRFSTGDDIVCPASERDALLGRAGL